MSRVALSLFLFVFSAIAAAQVVTPSLASEDGGGGCPDAATPDAEPATPAVGRADDVAPPAAAAEVPARTTPLRPAPPAVRPKPVMRWHSFLPGMMK